MDSLTKADSVIALQEPFLNHVSTHTARISVGNSSVRWYEDLFPFPRPKNPESRRFGQTFLDALFLGPYIGRMESLARHASASAFGFKILSHQAAVHCGLVKVLSTRQYSCIYLSRNPTRQVLSGMIANARSIYNSTSQPSKKIKVRIDFERMLSLIEWEILARQKDLQLLYASGMPMMEATYEQFVSDREKFFESIFEFIGILSEPPSVSDYRIIIDSLENHIDNFEEVCGKLSEAGFDW